MYTIAPAVLADAPVIHDIQMRAFAEEGRLSGTTQIPPLMEDVASIEHHIRTQTVMTARDDGRVIGSARGIFDGSICTIRGVSVEPSFHGQGIGGALLAAVERAHPDVERMALTTNTLVSGNVQFYERRGWHVAALTQYGARVALAQMTKTHPRHNATAPYSLLTLTGEQVSAIAQSEALQLPGLSIAREALPPPRVGHRALQRFADGEAPYWCRVFHIVRNADKLVVGSCCFKTEPKDGRVEIGYGIAPQWRRQGAAGSAVTTLLELAAAAGATQLLAQVTPDNHASAAVVRRAGFIDTGLHVDDAGETVMHWVARLSP